MRTSAACSQSFSVSLSRKRCVSFTAGLWKRATHPRGLLKRLWGAPAAKRGRIFAGGAMRPATAPGLLAKKAIDGGLRGGASGEAGGFAKLANPAAGAK